MNPHQKDVSAAWAQTPKKHQRDTGANTKKTSVKHDAGINKTSARRGVGIKMVQKRKIDHE